MPWLLRLGQSELVVRTVMSVMGVSSRRGAARREDRNRVKPRRPKPLQRTLQRKDRPAAPATTCSAAAERRICRKRSHTATRAHEAEGVSLSLPKKKTRAVYKQARLGAGSPPWSQQLHTTVPKGRSTGRAGHARKTTKHAKHAKTAGTEAAQILKRCRPLARSRTRIVCIFRQHVSNHSPPPKSDAMSSNFHAPPTHPRIMISRDADPVGTVCAIVLNCGVRDKEAKKSIQWKFAAGTYVRQKEGRGGDNAYGGGWERTGLRRAVCGTEKQERRYGFSIFSP